MKAEGEFVAQQRSASRRDVASALLWFLGLFGTVWLFRPAGTLFLALLPPTELATSGMVHLWFVPMPYLSAWLLLTAPSVARAFCACLFLSVAALCAAVFGPIIGFTVALAGGVFSFHAARTSGTAAQVVSELSLNLALPLLSFGAPAAFVGWALHIADASSRPDGGSEGWRRIHVVGMAAAGVGFAAPIAFASTLSRFKEVATIADAAIPWSGWLCYLAFAGHALLSWRQLRCEGWTGPGLPRTAALLGLAYLCVSVWIFLLYPGRFHSTWPLGVSRFP